MEMFPTPNEPKQHHPIFVQTPEGTLQDTGRFWNEAPPMLGEVISVGAGHMRRVLRYDDGPEGMIIVDHKEIQ